MLPASLRPPGSSSVRLEFNRHTLWCQLTPGFFFAKSGYEKWPRRRRKQLLRFLRLLGFWAWLGVAGAAGAEERWRIFVDREEGYTLRLPAEFLMDNPGSRVAYRYGAPVTREGQTIGYRKIPVLQLYAGRLGDKESLAQFARKHLKEPFTYRELAYYDENIPWRTKKWAPEGISAAKAIAEHSEVYLVRYQDRAYGFAITKQEKPEVALRIWESFEVLSPLRKMRSWREAQYGEGVLYDGTRYLHKDRARESASLAWKDAWEIETENYHLMSNISCQETLRLGKLLETLFGAYRAVFNYEGKTLLKLDVKVFRTAADFRSYLQARGVQLPPGARGYYSPTFQEICAFWIAPAEKGPAGHHHTYRILLHEGTHQFLHTICRGRIPPWLDEGLAVYFEASRFTDSGKLVTGLIPEERLKYLKRIYKKTRKPSMPYEKLMNHQEALPGPLYGEAWAIVHFLCHDSGGAHRKYFGQYYQAILAGQDPRKSFEEVFLANLARSGHTITDFENRVVDYVLRLPFR